MGEVHSRHPNAVNVPNIESFGVFAGHRQPPFWNSIFFGFSSAMLGVSGLSPSTSDTGLVAKPLVRHVAPTRF